MIVANINKPKTLTDPALFNAGNSNIISVKTFSYLGITLDSEMSTEPLSTSTWCCKLVG